MVCKKKSADVITLWFTVINRHVCHHQDRLSCATPISRRVARKHGWGRLSPRQLSEKKTLSQRHCVRLHMYYLSYPAAIPPVKLFFMAGDGFDSLSLPLKSITGVNCTLSLNGINPNPRVKVLGGGIGTRVDPTSGRLLAPSLAWCRTLLRW